MKPEAWTFPDQGGDPAEVWLPEGEAKGPAVVLAGDLFARPGRGLPSALGRELATRGYVAIAANPSAGRDTPRFKSGTLRDREQDAERLVTALFERMVAAGRADIRKLAVVGHGIGGAAAVAEAARDSRVGAAIAIAAPRTARAAFDKATIDAWASGKAARLKDPADGSLHEVGPGLFADWSARADELDHANGARRATGNVAWIHGTDDRAVDVGESRRAYWKHDAPGSRARLIEVAGADHDFGLKGEVPETLPTEAKKLVDAVVEVLETTWRR